MRSWAGWALLVAVSAVSVGCGVTDPASSETQPHIVLEVPVEFADILRDVQFFVMRVTRPGSTPRDTLLTPVTTPYRFGVNAALRPDEGEVGTVIEFGLFKGDVLMFYGRTTLATYDDGPMRVTLEVDPIADLVVETASHTMLVEETFGVASLGYLRFGDGTEKNSSEVLWRSTAPAIVEIVNGAAVARSPGSARLYASWRDQLHAIDVQVHPRGVIVVDTTSVLLYSGPSDRFDAGVAVQSAQHGSIGTLSVLIPPGNAWLSASLGTPTPSPATNLRIHVDGSLLPYRASPVEVTLRSDRAGVADATIVVTAVGEPATFEETREWDAFCMVGTDACVSIRAHTWTEGAARRVVLLVRNESPADERLEVTRLEVRDTVSAASVQGLQARPSGSVDLQHAPLFTAGGSNGRAQFSPGISGNTAVIGCQGPGWVVRALVTCAEQGFTGHLRVDVETPDGAWSLSNTRLGMRGYMDDVFFMCVDGDGVCEVR